MTRQKWTTDEQHAWLVACKPAFVEANQNKLAAKVFFPDVLREFCEKWPVPPCTQAELDDTKSKALAARVKKDAYEKRIIFWYHNNARSLGPSAASCAVLKVTPKPQPKKLQPWQAYQILYYGKWKPVINNAWAEFKKTWESEHPGEAMPKGQRLVFMMDFMKEKYALEPNDVKQKVEEYRQVQAATPRPVDNEDKKNQEYQSAINMLPRTLSTIGESLMSQTGWNITIMAGGPSPSEDGAMMTFLSHTGKTKEGQSFEKFLGNKEYETHLLVPFNQFLHASFSPEDCAARGFKKDKSAESFQGSVGGDDPVDGNVKEGREDKEQATEEEKSETEKTQGPLISKYEINCAKNIADLQGALAALNKQFGLPNLKGELEKKKRERKDKKEKPPKDTLVVRHESLRNKGPAADGEADKLEASTTPTTVSGDHHVSDITSPQPQPQSPTSISSPTTTSTAACSTTPSQTSGNISAAAAIIKNVIANLPCAANRALTPLNQNIDIPIAGTDKHSKEGENVVKATNNSVTSPSAARPSSADGIDKDIEDIRVSGIGGGDSMDTAGLSAAALADSRSLNKSKVVDSIAQEQTSMTVDTTPVQSDVIMQDAPKDPPVAHTAQQGLPAGPPLEEVESATIALPRMVPYLRGVSDDARWVRLVNKLFDFEERGYQTGNLPTKLHPKEITNWIKRKKKDTIPTLDTAEYGIRFRALWESMQPSWRKGDDDRLMREIPEGVESDMWTVLKRGGSAGMYMVVMGISWWIHTQQGENSADAWDIIEDLTWVFQQLMKGIAASGVSNKRVCEEDENKEIEAAEPLKNRRRCV